MMSGAYLLSVQVGLPQSYSGDSSKRMTRPWRTGFFKNPVEGLIGVGRTNLDGDGQADLKHHGGAEKAVLAYAAEHYPYWQKQLVLPTLPNGAFGENFTVVGQSEASVCIGDIYDIGDVQVQVSQPRQPCWKLSRRWQIQDLAWQVQTTGRTGWYLRVLREGTVESGLALILRDRAFPQWTIARANHLMHHELNNRAAASELASCPLLAPNWQKTLYKRATKNINPDSKRRLEGE